jgi:hypothetical protein
MNTKADAAITEFGKGFSIAQPGSSNLDAEVYDSM